MAASDSACVRLEIRDGVADLVLDRPPLNVLDLAMLRQLNAALAECDSSAVRVVLLRSQLERAFSAGVDVRDHGADRLPAMLAEVREQARRLLSVQAITIAAIHGATLGGGLELALLCDLVIAADDTRLSLPEIGLAAFPPIAAAIFPLRYSWSTVMRLLLGEPVDAGEALDLGLVASVVPSAELPARARARAADVAGYSGQAVKALIAALRAGDAGAALERVDRAIDTYQSIIGPSRDAQEGIKAFLEKRAPAWSHR